MEPYPSARHSSAVSDNHLAKPISEHDREGVDCLRLINLFQKYQENMFPNHYYDLSSYNAWRQAAQSGEGSSAPQRQETPPSSPSSKADSPQYSPPVQNSPENSPPPSYSTYEDNSTAPSRRSNRQGESSTKKKLLNLFKNFSLKSKNRGNEASTSRHSSSGEVSHSSEYVTPNSSPSTRAPSPARSSSESEDVPELEEDAEEASLENTPRWHEPQSWAGINRLIPSAVRSENTNGCVISCIAAIARLPYSAVRDIAIESGFFKPNTAKGIDVEEATSILKEMGFVAKYKRFESWGKLPPLSILFIKFHDSRFPRHAVVCDNSTPHDRVIFDNNFPDMGPIPYHFYRDKASIDWYIEIGRYRSH